MSVEQSFFVPAASQGYINDDDDIDGAQYWLNSTVIHEGYIMDYYSGAWLQPTEVFQNWDTMNVYTLEDASWRVYNNNRDKVRMSLDWLDFSVEHMSKFYRMIKVPSSTNNDVGMNRILDNFHSYIRGSVDVAGDNGSRADGSSSSWSLTTSISTSTARSPGTYPLLRPTVALVAFAPMGKVNHQRIKVREQSELLTVATLAATLVSMTKVGFGRILVVGLEAQDEVFVQRAMDMVISLGSNASTIATNKQTTMTEYSYIQIQNTSWLKTAFHHENRPKAAIMGLQLALRGVAEAAALVGGDGSSRNVTPIEMQPHYQQQWLGTTHPSTYWKYVYFTEMDNILHVKMSALPRIRRALEEGHVVMPHRLQPIPHERDVGGTDANFNFAPPRNVSSDHRWGHDKMQSSDGVFEMDDDSLMCCDMGMHHPGITDIPPAPAFFGIIVGFKVTIPMTGWTNTNS
jgi:hypothetical protein